MRGLLKRSIAYRRRVLGEASTVHEQPGSGDDSGISPQERAEILDEIERITVGRGPTLSSDVLSVTRAARRGFLFPLLVNVAMAILLGGGLFGLYTVFQEQEQQLAREEPGSIAAQGELIRRLREEAQQQLQQKEREIAEIRERLSDVEQRRNALEANFEEELARREAELRSELEAELEAERARLEREGAAEPEIDTRLSELEEEGNAEIEAELAEIRARAEAEREELDASLAQLESEFQSRLSELEAERESIAEEARRREQELRSGFEQELSEARNRLDELVERRQREQQAANQIAGFYSRIRAQIRAGNYDEAVASIEGLRGYLAEDSVAMLPNVQHRLDAELFILESLEQLIEQEREMRDTDTESLLARARLVDEFREERASRTTAANQAIAAAEQAYAASRYGEALSAYAEAVALIPQDATPAEDIVSNIRTAGAALSDSRAVEAQSEAAREPFGAAREAIAAGSYQQALELLLQVIREYPRSRQMGEVPEAIRTAVRQRAEEVESRIATLEQEVEQLRGRVEAAQSEVAAAQRDAQAAEARAEEAEAQALAAAQAASERREEENAQERAALEEELARLREIEQQYQALTRAYGSYAEREDEILATDAESARLQAKLLLDSFLASRPVQEALPGLRERIRAYDRAFEQAGRENALVDTADIVFELATYADPEAKIGFLEEQQESTDNPNMIDFLDQLEGLIAARR